MMRTPFSSPTVATVAVLGLIGTGLAARVGAQTPPPRAQPAYEQQLVTVEGCLRRESAPDEVARELAGDPEQAAVFVLVDTDVRSRIDTKPGTGAEAAEPSGLGPAGLPTGRPTPPANAATDADGQPARPASPPITGAATPTADRYVVAGLPDDRLKPFAGQRVALTGQFEPPLAALDPDLAADEPVGTAGAERWPGNLPRFRATSVKPVPGICPPKP